MENAQKVSKLFGEYAENSLADIENMMNYWLFSVPKFVSEYGESILL
jgi:hypothetical protein